MIQKRSFTVWQTHGRSVNTHLTHLLHRHDMLLLGMLLETAYCLRITQNTHVIDLSFAPITEHQSSMLHYRQSSAAVVVFLQGQSPDLFFFFFGIFLVWTMLLLNIKRTLRHSNGQTMPSVWFKHERIKTFVSQVTWLQNNV